MTLMETEAKFIYRDAKNKPLFLDAQAELLFLKYAIPAISCHSFTQNQRDLFAKQVSEEILPDINLEKTFGLAILLCKTLTKFRDKMLIDSDVIREYFLIEHNTSVDYRHNLGEKNLDPLLCKTYIGNVTEIGNGYARVLDRGEMKYNTVFVADVKIGDKVAVHYDFITEKITNKIETHLNSLQKCKKLLKTGA